MSVYVEKITKNHITYIKLNKICSTCNRNNYYYAISK